MAYDMFKKTMDSGMAVVQPNSWYRDLQQAFISSQWDNTTTLLNISEQNIIPDVPDMYANFEFTQIEAWVNTIVGQTSTGSKSGRDFVQLIFEDITHPKLEGRYYIIDNEYYISYFDNRVVDVDANLSVRRCNEWMKIIDPMTGSIYQIPCVVDYDMSAPSLRVTSSIITPNNHAVVKVQQNAMTDRLFKTNARFILGNRPFRITGMQNATNQFINNNLSSLMDIDLFLDELWDNDNIELGLADNGQYDYTVAIVGESMNLTQGSTGWLYTEVTLNGEVVDRVVEWSSDDKSVVTVTEDGYYEVVGDIGQTGTIKANLYGNADVFDEISITVVDESSATTEVIIDPVFNSIKEYETINFEVYGFYNGERIIPDIVNLTIPTALANSLSYTQNGNQFALSCTQRRQGEYNLTITIENTSPAFTITKETPIKLTSLLG